MHCQKEGSDTPKSPRKATRCYNEESGKCFIQWIKLTTAFRKYILSYCQANCLSLFLTFWLSDILRVRTFAWSQVAKGGASPKFFYAFWLETEKVIKYFAFCLLVLGIFHLFTRPSCSFSSQKALEDMERVKNNRITEFHFFLVVGGGITLPKKD